MPDELDDLIDALYARPSDEFTSARNEAAKALRKAKRGSEADAVTKLAKPTAPAAALNALARRRPDLVESLLQLGRQIRDAQALVLSGHADPALLMRAAEERRVAVRGLVAELSEASAPGHAQRSDEWTRTLEAASTDDAFGRLLRRGRLTRGAVAGLGFDGVITEPPTLRPNLRLVPPLSAEERQPDLEQHAREQLAREQQAREQQAHDEELQRQQHLQQERNRAIREAAAAEDSANAQYQAAFEHHVESESALRNARETEAAAQKAVLDAEQRFQAAHAALDEATSQEGLARQELKDAEQIRRAATLARAEL